MVWFGNRTPASNAGGLGFSSKHGQRQIKTTKNWHEGWWMSGARWSRAQSKAVKLLPWECDSSVMTHILVTATLIQSLFSRIFFLQRSYHIPFISEKLCLSQDFYCCDDQKQLGEKRVYLYTSISQFITEGSQDLMRRPWKVLLTGLLPMAYSA